ncbi:hypothetical protein CTAYLR_003117 [Chrysophaeum taylorii]|uniref:Uncharacterized protein n=1 Tax=Chrysophaeum taylorii TaxID=2483200 RepID=A0AAD7XQD5_9STRA|nr:hypothetical protein CTAYLR_003117 [Chrysophaeum taylorii]
MKRYERMADLTRVIAEFADGRIVTPKEGAIEVRVRLEYVYALGVGTPTHLELREADSDKFFATMSGGDTILINKRDLDIAAHILGPDAREVVVQFRCLLTIGCECIDLARCSTSRTLAPLARKCRGDGESLVRVDRPFYHVRASRVADLFDEIKAEAATFCHLFAVFPPGCDPLLRTRDHQVTD